MKTSESRDTVPLLDLKREYDFMKPAIDEALKAILLHQTWILGPEVALFEQRFSEYIGARFCIGASSGTEALLLALRAIALHTKGEEYFNEQDEIVTTAFSFTATGDTILRSRATPVFLDIDPNTYNIDLTLLENYLATSDGRVKAVIVVHLYGQCVDADKLQSIAKKYGVKIIEDIAQACGASWNGMKCGTIGDVGAFSFFPSKNLGAFGDAGMVTTSDPELADLIRILTKHGGKDKYDVQHIGYNARLDTIQAAILLAKLPYLEQFNQRRQAIAANYNREFSELLYVKPPLTAGPHHVYHQFTVSIPGGRRQEFKAHLDAQGITSMVYYPVPLHRMKVFQTRSKVPVECSHAEQAAEEVISLPIEPLLTDSEITRVIEAVSSF